MVVASEKNEVADRGVVTPQTVEVTEQNSIAVEYQGPIPPPSALAEYDSISPGLATRILTMAELESKHRHHIEKGALSANDRTALFKSWSEIIGQCFGFLIGLTAICAGTYLAANGSEGAGGFIGSAGVVGLVAVFVLGRDGYKSKGGKSK